MVLIAIRARIAIAAAGLLFFGVVVATNAKAASEGPAETATEQPQGPYLVADLESGRVIAHFDAVRPWFPASTTKLMTLYVALEAVRARQLTLDSWVTFTAYAAHQPPSSMGFGVGTVITLDNAIKMMMVKSANDVAAAVAETVGGSEEGFAERMNQAAQRLGMTRSHFVNPHGLPDSRQVTTARDMALLAQALFRDFPGYKRFFGIHAIQLGQDVMQTYNPLITRYPGATGMKTGFICASGYNLVATAKRGNREFVAIVFGAYGGMARAEEAAALLDEGFQSAGPPGVPPVTLASVSSGKDYVAPLDMRPHVCAPSNQRTASEANTDSDEEESEEPVSHLGLPSYLGPPIQVFVEMSGEGVRPGEPGFVARIPRARPALAANDPQAVLDAFAPDETTGDSAAPAAAIGSTLGAPQPLSGVNPE